jgi:peptide/nickel transport system substrate-binding protein
LGVDYIWFNLNKTASDGKPVGNPVKYAWFSDKRFRQAIAAAVDRASICTSTLQGLATPINGFVSPANRAWIDPNLPKIEYISRKRASFLPTRALQKKEQPSRPSCSTHKAIVSNSLACTGRE